MRKKKIHSELWFLTIVMAKVKLVLLKTVKLITKKNIQENKVIPTDTVS